MSETATLLCVVALVVAAFYVAVALIRRREKRLWNDGIDEHSGYRWLPLGRDSVGAIGYTNGFYNRDRRVIWFWWYRPGREWS